MVPLPLPESWKEIKAIVTNSITEYYTPFHICRAEISYGNGYVLGDAWTAENIHAVKIWVSISQISVQQYFHVGAEQVSTASMLVYYR